MNSSPINCQAVIQPLFNDDKIWIQHDGTEEGIADELVALGIPKHQIVLGFKLSDRRKLTEFAVS